MKMQLIIKKIMDTVLSAIGILILSPILLLIAIFIKVDSKGPVIFQQERLGRDGQIFSIYKFSNNDSKC